MSHHRIEDTKISVVNAIAAAGTGTTTTTAVDCAGAERVRWIVPITTTLDTGTLAATVHHSDDNSSFAATVATVTLTDAGGSQYNGQVLVVEVARPQKRYNRLVIVRATANSAFGAVVCERHCYGNEPVSNPSTAVASATKWNSPATA